MFYSNGILLIYSAVQKSETNCENAFIFQFSHLRKLNEKSYHVLHLIVANVSLWLKTNVSWTAYLRLPSLIGCLSDLSRGGECFVPLYKATVWAVLLPSDRHLPRPLLWTWFCALVPCEVTDGYTQTVTYIWLILTLKWLTAFCHLALWLVPFTVDMNVFWRYCKPNMCPCSAVYTQVISPSWYLLWSWRAHWPCGWARSVSTASETPSAPILSWSSAPRAWADRQRCWRYAHTHICTHIRMWKIKYLN